MSRNSFFSLKFEDDLLIYLDQTKLPFEKKYIKTDNYERIAEGIERLEIRGAPAIGIAAAFALALSIKNTQKNISLELNKAYQRLYRTRPTAVNLFYGLNEIKKVFDVNLNNENIYNLLVEKAKEIHYDDIEKCVLIAKNGLQIFKTKMNVLTHCNAGKLATGGDGTAINVIRYAFENGLVQSVFADETRPLLQGSRLTAFEFDEYGIPCTIITDSTAAYAMKLNKIDLVITGADRIASNGDTANKIGTYNLAVLCKHHNIPFYVAAPETTIDFSINSGEEISIELRNKREILTVNGVKVTKEEFETYSPAFDVTPSELISGIITDKKLYQNPYHFKK